VDLDGLTGGNLNFLDQQTVTVANVSKEHHRPLRPLLPSKPLIAGLVDPDGLTGGILVSLALLTVIDANVSKE